MSTPARVRRQMSFECTLKLPVNNGETLRNVGQHPPFFTSCFRDRLIMDSQDPLHGSSALGFRELLHLVPSINLEPPNKNMCLTQKKGSPKGESFYRNTFFEGGTFLVDQGSMRYPTNEAAFRKGATNRQVPGADHLSAARLPWCKEVMGNELDFSSASSMSSA